MPKGSLHLIPVPLSGGDISQLSASGIKMAQKIHHFFAENPKSARKFISLIHHPSKQAEIEVYPMDENSLTEDLQKLQAWIEQGLDIGIVSEAGLPCIADPGKKYVEWAHQRAVKVIAYPGPNSMMMALMASGLNGQEFQFHGYLPRKKEELRNKLHLLIKICSNHKASQIFMETPYRNKALMEVLLKDLPPNFLLSVSINLGTEKQFSITQTILQWRKKDIEFIHDSPAIFIISNS